MLSPSQRCWREIFAMHLLGFGNVSQSSYCHKNLPSGVGSLARTAYSGNELYTILVRDDSKHEMQPITQTRSLQILSQHATIAQSPCFRVPHSHRAVPVARHDLRPARCRRRQQHEVVVLFQLLVLAAESCYLPASAAGIKFYISIRRARLTLAGRYI
jgi:hypothetical protein